MSQTILKTHKNKAPKEVENRRKTHTNKKTPHQKHIQKMQNGEAKNNKKK